MAGADTERTILYGDQRFLAHRLRGRPRRYRMSQIDAPRPVSGETRAEVRCNACGKVVECTLYSPPLYRRWLLGRLVAIWMAVVAAHVVGYTWLVSAAPDHAAQVITLVSILEAALVFYGLMTSVLVFRDASSADGVRLRRRSRSHSVRPHGNLSPYGGSGDIWAFYPNTTWREPGI